ncbi:MAG: hypothetical protein ACRDN6_15635, partial [Gaiellaceae bacterium]
LALRGLAPARVRVRVAVPPATRRPADPSWARALAVAAGFGVVAVAVFALVGGFRSSPWLDDVWGIWLPKGVALDGLGLDPRLFADSGPYVSFEVLDYPLWWSILLNFDVRFVGEIDLRAANAQLTLLALAFLGSAARLLWCFVRPWVLLCALFLLAASPEFFRHAQGGIADLPLAIYLALTALVLAGWLGRRHGFYLLLAFVFAAAALQIKGEGLPQLLVIVAVASLVGLVRARSALPGIWLAAGAALLTALPWLAWRRAHDVESQVAPGDALSPAYLLDRTDRIGPSLEALARHLVSPDEWLVVVPLLVGLAIAGAVRDRRALWLAPALLLAAGLAFWVWAYWAETENLDYLLGTSAYRVVDSLVLCAWIFVPVQAELLLRGREAGASVR